MPCINMCTLWFLDLPLSLEEMVQKILKLKKTKRNSSSEAWEIRWCDDAKKKGFFCLDLLLLQIIMRSEIFWDPKFLRGIQVLNFGRSNDDDDAKQNGFFFYRSSKYPSWNLKTYWTLWLMDFRHFSNWKLKFRMNS